MGSGVQVTELVSYEDEIIAASGNRTDSLDADRGTRLTGAVEQTAGAGTIVVAAVWKDQNGNTRATEELIASGAGGVFDTVVKGAKVDLRITEDGGADPATVRAVVNAVS